MMSEVVPIQCEMCWCDMKVGGMKWKRDEGSVGIIWNVS